jgi:antibiotic biosynthesis monooxygenase (ABM) superfamily enzyme
LIVTVFRLRLSEDPAIQAEYLRWARQLNEIVPTLPGYVSHKRFTADDGERCTIVEFADMESLDAWSRHPVHLQAKELGRNRFFVDCDIKVASVLRTLKKATQ